MFVARLKQLFAADSTKQSTVLARDHVKEVGEASALTLGAPGGSGEGVRQTTPRFIPVPPRR